MEGLRGSPGEPCCPEPGRPTPPRGAGRHPRGWVAPQLPEEALPDRRAAVSLGPSSRSRSSRPFLSGWSRERGLPSVAVEIDASALVELDALLLQEVPLVPVPPRHGARAHLAARVDHPVPGKVRAVGKRMQRIPHLPRRAAEPRQRRDLAIRRDPALRDPLYDGIDAFVVGGRRWLHARDLTALQNLAPAPGSWERSGSRMVRYYHDNDH